MDLCAWMGREGVTTSTLARALGVSKAFVSQLRFGQRLPSLEVACAVEVYTNGRVKPCDFLHARREAQRRGHAPVEKNAPLAAPLE